MKLLTLGLLLSAFSSLALTEVVDSFKGCSKFFIQDPSNNSNHIVPTVFQGDQYRMICQRWKKQYRFVTLYDTEKRIPVYSAYTFLRNEKTEYRNHWKIEPQLDNITRDKKGNLITDRSEMMDSLNRTQAKDMNVTHQAVNSDYKDSNYTRGHVFPRSFAADQDQADSTFTLTNIAPQTDKDNHDWATQVEEPMLKNITHKCKLDQQHQAYIVTGVIPGHNWTKITRDQEYKEGINVPSHFWSAFCCTNKTNSKNLIGMAFIAQQENFTVWNFGFKKLNEELSKLYKKIFSVFPGLPIKEIKPPF